MLPRVRAWHSILVLVLAAPSMAQSQEPGAAEGSPSDPSTQEPTEQDRVNLAQLEALMANVELFAQVEVSVVNGIVKLRGSVKTPSQKEEIGKISRSLPGVVYVDNRIELPPPPEEPSAEDEAERTPGVLTVEDEQITEKLRASYARIPGLGEVQVEVFAGIVHLRGEVPSGEAQEQAITLAEKLDGVLFVSDETKETVNVIDRLIPSADRLFEYARDIVAALPLVVVGVLIIIGFWILGRWIERWNGLFDKLTDKRLISGVLKQTMRMVLLLLGIFLALEVMNATALVGAVLGTAGVVGLAVGFAFRDIVENYLASIILSIRQPFRSKDYVEIGDYAGTVIRMNLRETVLMSVDGNHLTFPNAHVFKSTVINYTRNPLRRFEVVVGVGTDVDLKKASDLGLDVLRAMAGVVDDPAPSSRFQTLGDSNVLLSFYGWVDQELADFIKVNSEAIRLLKAVFDQNDIDMPVPTYRVELLRSAGSDAFESLKRPRQSAQDEAKSVDVVVENHIEEQVEQEIRKSSETNLLEDEKGPKAGKEAPPEDRRSFE